MSFVRSRCVSSTSNFQRNCRTLLLFSFISALLFQLICSKNSPLYPMNDWVDVNCFFTVGKSLLNKKVLYRDIYEQKGPILYFIYAVIARISDTSFIGAFLIHTIAISLFLFFSARIVLSLTNNMPSAFISIPILALITHTTPAFSHGGSTEEMCLWMISATLYITVNSINMDSDLNKYESLVIGLFAGFVAYIKFTFLGFFFGIALFVLIWHIRKRRINKLFINVVSFLSGILIVSIPVFMYFGIHNAISDFLYAYFYNNIFLYDKAQACTFVPNPVLNRILIILRNFKQSIFINPVLFTIIFAGVLYLIYRKFEISSILLMVLLSSGFLAVGVHWGTYFPYYCMIFAPFAAFGFCWIKCKLHSVSRRIVCTFTICALTISFFVSSNTYLLHYNNEDMPQYRFATQINKVENATLLNYGFLDGGFYHAAHIEPSSKYFCKLNVPVSGMKEEQDSLIDTGSVDFVVTRNFSLNHANYVCIDACEFYFENDLYMYQLYKNTNIK